MASLRPAPCPVLPLPCGRDRPCRAKGGGELRGGDSPLPTLVALGGARKCVAHLEVTSCERQQRFEGTLHPAASWAAAGRTGDHPRWELGILEEWLSTGGTGRWEDGKQLVQGTGWGDGTQPVLQRGGVTNGAQLPWGTGRRDKGGRSWHRAWLGHGAGQRRAVPAGTPGSGDGRDLGPGSPEPGVWGAPGSCAAPAPAPGCAGTPQPPGSPALAAGASAALGRPARGGCVCVCPAGLHPCQAPQE